MYTALDAFVDSPLFEAIDSGALRWGDVPDSGDFSRYMDYGKLDAYLEKKMPHCEDDGSWQSCCDEDEWLTCCGDD